MAQHNPRTVEWEYRAERRWKGGAEGRASGQAGRLLASMPSPCGAALDAGCGSGRLALLMAGRAGYVTGLDISEDMLALARRRHSATTLDNATWVHGSILSLPFDSASFDFVASVFVLHLVDPNLALPELRRVLRPGGRLALLTAPGQPSPGRRLGRDPVELAHLARCAASMYGIRWACQYALRRALRSPGYYHAYTTVDGSAALREACSRLLPGWQGQDEPGKGTLTLWENG